MLCAIVQVVNDMSIVFILSTEEFDSSDRVSISRTTEEIGHNPHACRPALIIMFHDSVVTSC
jgi:hypothetical protein